VSKLYKLREWLQLEEAASYLSEALGETVDSASILRLALDGYLRLSVNLVNKATVRFGTIVTLDEANKRDFSLPPGSAPVTVVTALDLGNGRYLNLEDQVTTIEGIWDLPMPMIGSERLDIEHRYQNLTFGPAVTLVGLDGAFLEGPPNMLLQIQDFLRDEAGMVSGYYPAGGLPDDSVVVVRLDELIEFQKRPELQSTEQRKPIGGRAESTYLNIIGALLDLLVGTTPDGRRKSAYSNQTAVISAIVERFPGVDGLSSRNLETKFPQAKRSLISG
jgi:hypothetical protein